MPHTARLLPRQQVFVDLASQLPEVDPAAVELYAFFSQLARQTLAAQQAFYDRYDLSEGKLIVLLLLRQAPEYRLTPSALAEAASVTRATMTGLLAGLDRAGLVKRTAHPEDGRMATIELTQAALDLFGQVLPERSKHIGAFMAALTEEEQAQLKALLEKLDRRLAALYPA